MALLFTVIGCSGTPLCLASPDAKEAGNHPGPFEWPGQARTHPGLLLLSLELCVDLLRACVLPCPAFVASLSPCTRIGSLGRWEEISFLDCPEPQGAVSCLRSSHQRLQRPPPPPTKNHPNLYFPTFTCSKGQKRQHVTT